MYVYLLGTDQPVQFPLQSIQQLDVELAETVYVDCGNMPAGLNVRQFQVSGIVSFINAQNAGSQVAGNRAAPGQQVCFPKYIEGAVILVGSSRGHTGNPERQKQGKNSGRQGDGTEIPALIPVPVAHAQKLEHMVPHVHDGAANAQAQDEGLESQLYFGFKIDDEVGGNYDGRANN